MAELFNNKVAESGIVTIDLASLLPSNEIVVFDIKPYLFRELILKEKDFRAALLTTDWTIYKDKVVGIICSADAIIPMWANMLIVSALNDFAKSVYFGDETKVREQVLLENIASLSPEAYSEQRIVVKGCGDTPIGESAYIAITQKLRPVVKSIMYGEPCSTVPVYKKKA
ncbi:MAG: DUF2480 family protein [Bacteroidetes bacterium]|jgi:hypothetical protein|nr:DUF2480 family protein [Bacteroidota bacterium]